MGVITNISVTDVFWTPNVPHPRTVLQVKGTFTVSDGLGVGPAWYVFYAVEETAAGITRHPMGEADLSIGPGRTVGGFNLEVSARNLFASNVQYGDTIKFVLRNETSGVDVITTEPTIICFYPGTRIATPSGEATVETLAIGDMVLRQDGTAAAIRWIGRNTVAPLFADKMKALPIRIRKDAIDDNVPCRDLLVSPAHAILVDGNLVQAAALINGSSITRQTDVPQTFVYYHIELTDHALIMAENTPAETFIDNVDRMAFDNWAEHEALYVDQPALIEMDLPRAKSRRQVPVATRDRLEARALALGHASTADAA